MWKPKQLHKFKPQWQKRNEGRKFNQAKISEHDNACYHLIVM
jgi:hypothetical protein